MKEKEMLVWAQCLFRKGFVTLACPEISQMSGENEYMVDTGQILIKEEIFLQSFQNASLRLRKKNFKLALVRIQPLCLESCFHKLQGRKILRDLPWPLCDPHELDRGLNDTGRCEHLIWTLRRCRRRQLERKTRLPCGNCYAFPPTEEETTFSSISEEFPFQNCIM